MLRSGHCLRGSHERCGHFSDLEAGSVWRRRPTDEHVLTLCRCDCHAGCPLAGRGTVVRAVWRRECTCPGSGRIRELEAWRVERGREFAEVMATVRRDGHLSAGEIEARLRAVPLAHGEPPPLGLASWARIAAAGTGPRGTRTPRLLWMGLRSVARTIRWAVQPGAASANRAEARRLFWGVAVVPLVALGLTARAVRSSGWRRAAALAGALVGWLATVWVTALGVTGAALGRFADEHLTGGAGGEVSPPAGPGTR
jgi:hypothetical protein